MSPKDIVIMGSIVLGVLIFIAILHSEKKKRKKLQKEFEELKESIKQDSKKADIELRMKQLKEKADNVIEEINDNVENKLSTLSNNKIMEFDEYANQLLEKIDINHKEVVFLYDMLNSKEESVKETVAKLQKLKVEVTELIANNTLSKEEKKDFNLENIDVKDFNIKTEDYNKKVAVNEEINKVKHENISYLHDFNEDSYKDENDMNNVVSKDSSVEDIDIVASKDDFVDLLRCCEEYDSEGNDVVEEDIVPEELTLKNALDEQSIEGHIGNAFNKSKGKTNNYQKRNEQIIKLYSLGYSTVEISKRLGIGTGEVALVNHLYS